MFLMNWRSHSGLSGPTLSPWLSESSPWPHCTRVNKDDLVQEKNMLLANDKSLLVLVDHETDGSSRRWQCPSLCVPLPFMYIQIGRSQRDGQHPVNESDTYDIKISIYPGLWPRPVDWAESGSETFTSLGERWPQNCSRADWIRVNARCALQSPGR